MGGGRFIDLARPLGADADSDGRGVCVADIDGDGRLDVVMSNNNGPPTVYLNRLKKTGGWARLTLTGKGCNRDAVGALVRLTATIGGVRKTLLRQVEAGSSYASQSDFAVHFGVGDAPAVEALEVEWPDGVKQEFQAPQLDGLMNHAACLTEGGEITRRGGER